jgi:hypothetical protein
MKTLKSFAGVRVRCFCEDSENLTDDDGAHLHQIVRIKSDKIAGTFLGVIHDQIGNTLMLPRWLEPQRHEIEQVLVPLCVSEWHAEVPQA